ncbi:hypothetical protein [Aquamicrobium sp.]|uniref:hypothetical protein n=1 Tax=Aquamicrobium sp. TaxID=1872579 RepID=UPI00258EC1E3|nr:hypothetical protein [Aquamicrobium sp.]MCK9549294.1 hypothetical protein [Aquamicrobium sp.]
MSNRKLNQGFTFDTKIMCQKGIKNIKDVKKTDSIITPDGNYKAVTKIKKQEQQIVTIKAYGILDIKCGYNRMFYTKQTFSKFDQASRGKIKTILPPEWITATNLSRSDYIGIPIIKTEENPLDITKKEAYILGGYIGSGYFKKQENDSNIILTMPKDKALKFSKNILLDHLLKEHSETRDRIFIKSPRLLEIIEKNCGVGASEKYISNMLLDLPINILEGLLAGYFDSEGFLIGDATMRTKTMSKNLAVSLQFAILKCYKELAAIQYNKIIKKVPGGTNESKTYENYTVYLCTKKNYKADFFIEEDIAWTQVLGITMKNNYELVYDIKIEDNSSYMANSAIVENVQCLFDCTIIKN